MRCIKSRQSLIDLAKKNPDGRVKSKAILKDKDMGSVIG